jgi:hypothetical protein
MQSPLQNIDEKLGGRVRGMRERERLKKLV